MTDLISRADAKRAFETIHRTTHGYSGAGCKEYTSLVNAATQIIEAIQAAQPTLADARNVACGTDFRPEDFDMTTMSQKPQSGDIAGGGTMNNAHLDSIIAGLRLVTVQATMDAECILNAADAITALRAQLAAANARADRAEAALAAQTDHARIKPIACAPEDIAILVAPEHATAEDWQVSWWITSEGRWANWNWSNPPHEWAPLPNRSQPHDRTALDRMLADAEAKALRKAAHVAANACLVPPDGGNPTEEERLVCEEAYRRILAMIEPT